MTANKTPVINSTTDTSKNVQSKISATLAEPKPSVTDQTEKPVPQLDEEPEEKDSQRRMSFNDDVVTQNGDEAANLAKGVSSTKLMSKDSKPLMTAASSTAIAMQSDRSLHLDSSAHPLHKSQTTH